MAIHQITTASEVIATTKPTFQQTGHASLQPNINPNNKSQQMDRHPSRKPTIYPRLQTTSNLSNAGRPPSLIHISNMAMIRFRHVCPTRSRRWFQITAGEDQLQTHRPGWLDHHCRTVVFRSITGKSSQSRTIWYQNGTK